jgi:hypothetical protein
MASAMAIVIYGKIYMYLFSFCLSLNPNQTRRCLGTWELLVKFQVSSLFHMKTDECTLVYYLIVTVFGKELEWLSILCHRMIITRF